MFRPVERRQNEMARRGKTIAHGFLNPSRLYPDALSQANLPISNVKKRGINYAAATKVRVTRPRCRPARRAVGQARANAEWSADSMDGRRRGAAHQIKSRSRRGASERPDWRRAGPFGPSSNGA